MSQFTPPTPPSYGTPAGMQPHRGTVILVLGILSIVVCFICGIVAWVMGNNDMRAINAGTMDPSGRGLTNAGRILGIVGTVLGGIGLLVALVWMVFVFFIIGTAAAAGAGRHP